MQIQHLRTQQTEDIQLKKLIQEEIHLILMDASNKDEAYQKYNTYFDKQLTHLVVSEQFNFTAISAILSQIFQNERFDTSEISCRLRWDYLHKNRNKMQEIKQKEKEEKRAISVASFSNPYSLYSVDQLIETLEQSEKFIHSKSEKKSQIEINNKGYNIFKDNFRKIQDFEQYNLLQAKMKQALKKAQSQIYEDAPLYYTPQYENLQSFEVNSQQLTAEKARQLMTYQIQMQKISRELQQKKEEEQQQKYEQIIKKRIEKEQKMKKLKNADIEQNWDQYESD